MPYSHIATEERDFLQSAFALSIDKSIIARYWGSIFQPTAVRFNMTNPPKKVVKYQEAAVNSLDSKFL